MKHHEQQVQASRKTFPGISCISHFVFLGLLSLCCANFANASATEPWLDYGIQLPIGNGDVPGRAEFISLGAPLEKGNTAAPDHMGLGLVKLRIKTLEASAQAGFAPAESLLSLAYWLGWSKTDNSLEKARKLAADADRKGNWDGKAINAYLETFGSGSNDYAEKKLTKSMDQVLNSMRHGSVIGYWVFSLYTMELGIHLQKDKKILNKYKSLSACLAQLANERGMDSMMTRRILDADYKDDSDESISAKANMMMGQIYQLGLYGMAKDPSKAAALYKQAAEQGDTEAQYSLGNMYLHGEGVAQDNDLARSWLELAADSGYARAENDVGVLYSNGIGVPVNYQEAAVWFNKAAAHGFKLAKENLAKVEHASRLARQSAPVEEGPAISTDNVNSSQEEDDEDDRMLCHAMAGDSLEESILGGGNPLCELP